MMSSNFLNTLYFQPYNSHILSKGPSCDSGNLHFGDLVLPLAKGLGKVVVLHVLVKIMTSKHWLLRRLLKCSLISDYRRPQFIAIAL